MRDFIICIPCQILFHRSNQGKSVAWVGHMHKGNEKPLQSFGAEFVWQAENLLPSQEEHCPLGH